MVDYGGPEGYGGGYSGPSYSRSYPSRSSSGWGRTGSLLTGAALGYAAHEIQDRLKDKEQEDLHNEPEPDNDDYGDWDGNRSGSSSNHGFSGGGASSDW